MSHLSCPLWLLSLPMCLSLDKDKMEGSMRQEWEFTARWLKIVLKVLSGSKRLRRCYSLISLKARVIWCGPHELVIHNQRFPALERKLRYTCLNKLWWEWLSLDYKLKDWLGLIAYLKYIPLMISGERKHFMKLSQIYANDPKYCHWFTCFDRGELDVSVTLSTESWRFSSIRNSENS